MRKQHCPLCKKDFSNKNVEFTLTNPTKKMLKKYDEETIYKIQKGSGWINACPWCFEKTIE